MKRVTIESLRGIACSSFFRPASLQWFKSRHPKGMGLHQIQDTVKAWTKDVDSSYSWHTNYITCSVHFIGKPLQCKMHSIIQSDLQRYDIGAVPINQFLAAPGMFISPSNAPMMELLHEMIKEKLSC